MVLKVNIFFFGQIEQISYNEESFKKNLQFFIFENLIFNIKLYLKSFSDSPNPTSDLYRLTIKYDTYVTKIIKNYP